MKRSSVGGPLSRCGRDEESSIPDSSAASHRDTCISSSKRRSNGQLFFHLVPRLPGGERTCVWRTQRTRSFPPPLHFHFHFSSALFSIPPLLLSLPTAPSPSIRSPRSAYLREIHRATQSLRRLAKVSLRLSPAGSALLLFAPLFVVRPSPSLPSRAASRRPRTDFWLINEPHPSITSSRIVDGTIGGNGGGNDRYTSKLLFILGEIFIEFYTRLRYDMLFCAYDCEN